MKQDRNKCVTNENIELKRGVQTLPPVLSIRQAALMAYSGALSQALSPSISDANVLVTEWERYLQPGASCIKIDLVFDLCIKLSQSIDT